jgi:hypothetical protein
MTVAHTAFARLLYDNLDHLADIVLRRGVMPDDEDGDVEFATRTVTANHDLDFPDWVATVTHELVHLNRGPGWNDQVDAEEAEVREETARLLVPRSVLPSILEAANPTRVAAEQGVDEQTARTAIELARMDRDEALRQGAGEADPEGIA